MNKNYIVQNLIDQEFEFLGEHIIIGKYNFTLSDDTISSLFSIDDPDNVDEEYVEMIEVDGDEYPVAVNCSDFASLIFSGCDAFGIGRDVFNKVVTIKNRNVSVWDIVYCDEETSAELMIDNLDSEDIQKIINEIDILTEYEDVVFRGDEASYLKSFKDALNSVLETLPKTELDVEAEVERRVKLAKAECEIDKIENPVIVEKEITKVVYEEVEVVKEVKVPCPRTNSFYD